MAASTPSVPVRLSVALSTLGQIWEGQKYLQKVKDQLTEVNKPQTSEKTYISTLSCWLLCLGKTVFPAPHCWVLVILPHVCRCMLMVEASSAWFSPPLTLPYCLLCTTWDRGRGRWGRGERGMMWHPRVGGVMFQEPWGCHVFPILLYHTTSWCTQTARAQQARRHKAEQTTALMYPKLMFNEYAIFRLVHAKSENGFIVLLLKGACVCVCREACSVVLTRSKCVCQSVFTSVCRVPDKCIH